MSTKPIDEFLQDCTVWLEKIAAAKQREEAAYAAINNVQMEKKALRMLARGAGRTVNWLGRGMNVAGRYTSKLGQKLQNAGAKPKPITLQNPLAKQVSAALKSGKPQPKLIRNADGSVAIGSPLKAPKPAAKPTQQPRKPATPAAPEAPVPPPQAKTPQPATKGQPAAETPAAKPADAKAPVDSPNGQAAQGTQAGASAQPGAGTEAAAGAAQSGRFGKIMPYALIGGAGFLAGRSTAPDPVYTSPAMVHNNMLYQQSQQAATPNIY